jgi:uncharacterized membrane protein YfcA
MLHLTLIQWTMLAIGAFGIGLSKTGIAGFGIVAVALFAVELPAKLSVGYILPVLITGDLCAVLLYKRKVVWKHLIYLFPWAIVGVVLGYFALDRIDNAQVSKLIAAILIVLTGMQIARQRSIRRDSADTSSENSGVRQSQLVMAVMGVLAGFTTMVANAAGPIMILYLLATRLPKVEFIGTAAWFFFFLNLFKVPFSAGLGLINTHSLPIDALLAPLVVIGAIAGRAVVEKIDQRLFENIAIALTLVAAVKLML